VRQFGIKDDQGPSDSTLNEPVGVVVSAAGDVFVADYWNRRVVQLDGEFNFVGAFDVPAWGSEVVTNRPYMAILPDGRLLLTDPEHAKVLAYDAEGTLITEYEVPVTAGRSSRPIGVAVADTHVLVSDGSGSVVRKIPLSEILP
jgi:streptogramin lyase